MNIHEKLWENYKKNTTKDISDQEGSYNIMYQAEILGDGGQTVSFKALDRHHEYDFESVYGQVDVALYEQDVLFVRNFEKAIEGKSLEGIVDEMFPQWKEDWEIPNSDLYSNLDMDDLLEDIRFHKDGMRKFMAFFGYARLLDSDLWFDTNYVAPFHEDPNQLKLDFGV